MAFITHIGRESLAPLAPRWGELATGLGSHIFQRPAFCLAWAETVGVATHAKPIVVEYADGGATTALFPACIVNVGPLRIITWLGAPHVLDYGDILHDAERCSVTAEQFMLSAIDLLKKRAPGAFLYLTNVRDDAVCLPVLERCARKLKSSEAPYIEMAESYEAYLGGLTRKRRHNLERVERKLARAGEVRFELLRPEDEGFSAAFHTLMDLYRLRFSDREDGAPIFDEAHERFRLRQTQLCSGSSVGWLTLDGELVAASLQCMSEERFYFLIQAFDARFAEFSPGRILTARLLEHAHEAGMRVFDFCWGAEPYKYEWTSSATRLDTFISANAAGRALSLAVALRRMTRITPA